ncbi:lipopolysaccharide heptosyltransferase I [Thioflexithrix psekupsensis]|uniref:Lipopolysaccharide heptosyltransferase 1 n=1 Tax=Thioflexithrix psekupsensis TaxID=1570016 RepID=A0A251XBP6_9GAMM|nr:lipopolysaccharide heptosyltransferase I [Thioflexithrix psekupsensis]OUD15500.1 lipopolysaccharide heptosyltransferase I [Thioflexithrix psekupsensis]
MTVSAILLIKLSSLGDVIHTLPALSDARRIWPELQIDWVVEEAFVPVAGWHPAVRTVIPIALRRWRHHWRDLWREFPPFRAQLRAQTYDQVIDAQGLLKSAIVAAQARGTRYGFDRHSSRESLSHWFYQQHIAVPKQAHAVERTRQLFARILGYACPTTPPDYGIAGHFEKQHAAHPTLIFLHGTTWSSKHWPIAHWQSLAQLAVDAGYHVQVAWGSALEQARASAIMAVHPHVSLIPRTDLAGMAQVMLQAKAVVGVDTGLSHLAAALSVPSVTVYSATAPERTGTYGTKQVHLQAAFPCSPCLRRHCYYQGKYYTSPVCARDLSVERVWMAIEMLI